MLENAQLFLFILIFENNQFSNEEIDYILGILYEKVNQNITGKNKYLHTQIFIISFSSRQFPNRFTIILEVEDLIFYKECATIS